ncbi:hypothetical protein PR048_029791 [Dryococelus australis]|uniref:Polyprotein n=1 Tax=Dryococelus australis TaxID=614101 RepID=A0ABQ9G756_9NEOP|nr:hypothetical protein PR048_029791 [Dryococelus australis]
MRDELIKERIVSGISDNTLRQRLLREHNLTLIQAIDTCRTAELTDKRLEMFQEEVAAVQGVVTCSNVRLRNSGLQNKYTTRLGMDQFKLDSGAQENLIPVKLFHRLNKIPFLGKCFLKFTYNGRVRVLEFCVVEKDCSPFFELSACVLLDFVRKVETVQSKTGDSNLADLISMYTQCFEGIRELPGDHRMILRVDAKPVVHDPRRVSGALREPLRQNQTD